MIKKWMAWVNFTAAGIIVALLAASVCLLLMKPNQFLQDDVSVRKLDVPKGAFTKNPPHYDSIKEPVLSLKYTPPGVLLPDLRRQLNYFGRNGRPDAKEDNPVLYFAFGQNKTPTPLLPGKKYYVLYDKSQKQYIFSENNKETSLWIEVTPHSGQVSVKVRMKGDQDQIISEPTSNAEFALAEKEFIRTGSTTSWELGKWRVDGTLLARQKARWYGIDKFLEKHGGEEYKGYELKQRIDFGEPEETYSVYVGPEDCMVWKDGKWQVFKPGEDTLGYPLLCVKKVDERIVNLELWDVEGKGKIVLNLLKTTEAWQPQSIMQGFKFMGARTRSQFVFEINKERMLLRPHDWLVLTDKGWQKLVTPQEIDNYVDRKIVGPMFVFDGIEKKEDRQVIMGTLFNAARTEKASIELPLQNSGTSGSNDPNAKGAIPGGKKMAVPERNGGREPPIPRS